MGWDSVPWLVGVRRWGWEMGKGTCGGWFVRGVAVEGLGRVVVVRECLILWLIVQFNGGMVVVWQRQRQMSRSLWFVDCSDGRISRSAFRRVRFDV